MRTSFRGAAAPRRLAARLAFLLAATMIVVGCSAAGSGSLAPSGASAAPSAASSGAASASSAGASPSINLPAEIDATVAGIDAAVAIYKAGNIQGAMDKLAETYEQHFDQVEKPLDAINETLTDDLEGLIATKLRAAVQANNAADVDALAAEAKTKLATARALVS